MGPIDKLAGRQMLLCCFGFRFLRIVPVDFEIFQAPPTQSSQAIQDPSTGPCLVETVMLM